MRQIWKDRKSRIDYINPLTNRKLSSEMKIKLKNAQMGKKHSIESIRKRMKYIERIDPNTGEIKEYFGGLQIKNDGFNINGVLRCCSEKQQKYKNYFWRHKND